MHSPFKIDMIVFNDCLCIIQMLCIIDMMVQKHLGRDGRKAANPHSLVYPAPPLKQLVWTTNKQAAVVLWANPFRGAQGLKTYWPVPEGLSVTLTTVTTVNVGLFHRPNFCYSIWFVAECIYFICFPPAITTFRDCLVYFLLLIVKCRKKNLRKHLKQYNHQQRYRHWY